jgi:hypothetical protein
MASFTVHVPTAGPDALARARFVRDGFSWSAGAFGPFWLFSQCAWIAGLLVVAAYALLGGLVALLRLDAGLALAGFGLLQLGLALEGASLIRWELGLKGWREVGLVAGGDPDVMERRFFEAELARAGPPAAGGEPASYPAQPYPTQSAPRGGIIGLFPAAPGHSVQSPSKART